MQRFYAKIPFTTFPCTTVYTQSIDVLSIFAWLTPLAGRVPGLQPAR